MPFRFGRVHQKSTLTNLWTDILRRNLGLVSSRHQTWKYVEIEILQFFIIDVFPIKTPHL